MRLQKYAAKTTWKMNSIIWHSTSCWMTSRSDCPIAGSSTVFSMFWITFFNAAISFGCTSPTMYLFVLASSSRFWIRPSMTLKQLWNTITGVESYVCSAALLELTHHTSTHACTHVFSQWPSTISYHTANVHQVNQDEPGFEQLAPQYLTELCIPATDAEGRCQLISGNGGLLNIPPHELKTYGWCAFYYAGPSAWNSLLRADPGGFVGFGQTPLRDK